MVEILRCIYIRIIVDYTVGKTCLANNGGFSEIYILIKLINYIMIDADE